MTDPTGAREPGDFDCCTPLRLGSNWLHQDRCAASTDHTHSDPAEPTDLPEWLAGEVSIDLGPAVEASARAYAADMGLSLPLVSPTAAARLREQVFAWLQPAVPLIVGQSVLAINERYQHLAELEDRRRVVTPKPHRVDTPTPPGTFNAWGNRWADGPYAGQGDIDRTDGIRTDVDGRPA